MALIFYLNPEPLFFCNSAREGGEKQPLSPSSSRSPFSRGAWATEGETLPSAPQSPAPAIARPVTPILQPRKQRL